MLKRYCILICTAVVLLLYTCTSCENKQPIVVVEQPDGTFLWNGLQIIREDNDWYGNGASSNFFASENVITTKDRTLTISMKNSSGDPREYGMNEFIQVNLDGVWYTLPQQLSQNEEPLILEGINSSNRKDPAQEYTIDFSVIGELPPGKYCFVESFYWERLKEESYQSAYFWVIEPDGKRPPESETTGKARKEDIVFYVESLYEARRCITDKDIWFGMFIENLSGKNYYIEEESPILEMKKNGIWERIYYEHANVGLLSGWNSSIDNLFLYEPLKAGRYRIRLPMHTNEPGDIELKYEFDVTAYKDAPQPKWEVSRLKLSPYDASNQSTGVIMSFTNPVLNKDNTNLEILLTAEKQYIYGEPYEVEVLLDGKWYRVPSAGGGFSLPAYPVGPNAENEKAVCSCNPVFFCGVLPVGQYRIIKDFDLQSSNPNSEGLYINLAKEIVMAEFTVEEMLGSEDDYIELLK